MTGEDFPRGHSILARLSAVEVQKDDVNLPRLTECQREAAGGRYAMAMAGFVAWLAPRYGRVLADLPAQKEELRDRFISKGGHSRSPDVIANQLLGLHHLRRFAENVGALDRRASAEL